MKSDANHSLGMDTEQHFRPLRSLPLPAILILLATTCISVFWSHSHMLGGDEFYEMWTDRVPTLGQVIHIQLTDPVALDPIGYHVLSHACIRIFGETAFAIRLPALIAFLIMQVCLYLFIKRIANKFAALLAMTIPAFTCGMSYSMEGRPYTLVLALFGLCMVCWQSASRRSSKRKISLSCLALFIALTINTHYFGILILLPLCAVEVFRTLQSKRMDVPMILAIVAGGAGIIFTLPFAKAARMYKPACVPNSLSIKTAVWPYLWTFSFHSGSKIDRPVFALMGILVLSSLGMYFYRIRQCPFMSSAPETVFIYALVLLPVAGLILASMTSSVSAPRYVIGVVIGISCLVAMGLAPEDISRQSMNTFALTVIVLILGVGLAHILNERILTDRAERALLLSPSTKYSLLANPDSHLYIQDLGTFATAYFYEKDPQVRSKIVLLYSQKEEIKWNREYVISMTAQHLHNFAQIPIASFDDIVSQPGDHIFVDFVRPIEKAKKSRDWNWIGCEFSKENAQVNILGAAFLTQWTVIGDVDAVRIRKDNKNITYPQSCLVVTG